MSINEDAISRNNRNCDRRSGPPFFCKFQLGIKRGRRKENRRNHKTETAYIDVYSKHLVLCVIGIMILSSLDAFFTLNILSYGGKELNIFMDVLIAENIKKFIAIKLALTALALILLTIHHNVKLTKKFRVAHLMYLIFLSYTVLIGYEITLLKLASA